MRFRGASAYLAAVVVASGGTLVSAASAQADALATVQRTAPAALGGGGYVCAVESASGRVVLWVADRRAKVAGQRLLRAERIGPAGAVVRIGHHRRRERDLERIVRTLRVAAPASVLDDLARLDIGTSRDTSGCPLIEIVIDGVGGASSRTDRWAARAVKRYGASRVSVSTLVTPD